MDGDETALARKLNRQEVTGVDAPPSFGAWCAHANWVRLTYVGFIPNVLYVPGSAGNMCSWLLPRAKQARALIANLQASEEADEKTGNGVTGELQKKGSEYIFKMYSDPFLPFYCPRY